MQSKKEEPSQSLAMGYTPGWVYFDGMEVVGNKLAFVESTGKHGNMPLLGISRFSDLCTFRCDVPGAFWFDLQIDFRLIESQNHGRIAISMTTPDGSEMRPTSHEQLCGTHTHYLTPTTDTAPSSDFAPISFQSFIFVGILNKGNFSIDFSSELSSITDNQIKANLIIRRIGFGIGFFSGITQ